MTPMIRVLCGILGIAGVAALAFNAMAEGGIEADFTFFSSLFGAFVFIYAALFGTLPWGGSGEVEQGEGHGEMTRNKWQLFWIILVSFLVVTTAFLAGRGIFREADIVVLAIVGILFAVFGIALYFFIKHRAEDTNIRW